ncbi:MAG: cobalamin biosynthesis protein CbiK [Desulfobacterales bacterium]|nr:MAG: cobalamin biosynthesis protein CbiK [Desulfobacterales bacterium]
MDRHGYIGRKMRQPSLYKEPAIIIAAFGSSRRGKAAYALLEQKLQETFPDREIFWSFSSDIIRKKSGSQSLHQVLAAAEAAGYKKAVVQPLHVFPGTEYQQIRETCEYFPGMRVITGETLMHRWDFIEEMLTAVSSEFIAAEAGFNILVLHGTPLAADPVNAVYLGLEKMVTDLYDNVFCVSVEGVPSYQGLIRGLKATGNNKNKRVHLIPLMYLAGLHVEDDLMGDEESWKKALEEIGFTVTCAVTEYEGERYFKGLAFYPEAITALVERLQRSLSLSRYY